MNKPQRTLWALLIKTAVFTGLLLGTYYIAWLRPSLAVPNALADVKQDIVTLQQSLLQSRLSLLELTRLNPTAANFDDERQRLLTAAQAAITESQQHAQGDIHITTISGAPREVTTFLNQELPNQLSALIERHRQVTEKQQDILKTITTLDASIAKIFAYSPISDIGELNLANQQTEAIARAQRARDGLRDISNTLTNNFANAPEIQQLQSSIRTNQELFTSFATSLQRNDITRAREERDLIIQEFTALKYQALQTELSLLRTDQSITVLTEHTNILLGYNFWLRKVEMYQREL